MNLIVLLDGSRIRSIVNCLTLLLWLGVAIACAQRSNVPVPNAIRSMLDKEYRGWRLAESPCEVQEYFRHQRVSFAPNLLNGDFNGDGKRDYALLIEHRNRLIALAFVNKGRGFTKHTLETPPKGEVPVYLWLYRKGERDTDYETGKEFVYRTDAIGVMYYEKAGVSYVYERGRFRRVITSD